MSDRAKKNGLAEGKIQWHLLPVRASRGLLRVLMYGARKYAEWNWTKGMPYSELYDGVNRHLSAWWYDREDLDPESGLPHLWHALAGLTFLAEYGQMAGYGEQYDDRPFIPSLVAASLLCPPSEPLATAGARRPDDGGGRAGCDSVGEGERRDGDGHTQDQPGGMGAPPRAETPTCDSSRTGAPTRVADGTWVIPRVYSP